MLNDIRTSTITSKGQIVIPKELREFDGFHPGQKIALLTFDDHIEIRPFSQITEKIDFEKERKKSRVFLKKFVKTHNLNNKKIKKLNKKEKNDLANSLL